MSEQELCGITDVVGEYSEEAKRLAGQMKLIAEFPCLNAAIAIWPIDELKVSNAAADFMRALDSHFRPGVSELWIHTETSDAMRTFCLPDVDPYSQKAVIWPAGERWGKILGDSLAGIDAPILYAILVLRAGDSVKAMLCRHKNRGESLNKLADVWARVNEKP